MMSAQEGPTFGPQHRQESLSLRSAHSVCPATKAQGGLNGEPPGYSPRPRSCHCIAHRCACMPRRRAEGRAREASWRRGGGRGSGPRGPGAWGKGAGSDRFGPAGRPPALSQRARAQGSEGKGRGLPSAALPARPAGRGTHLACPRRPSPSPRRSHPCPSALPLSPRETRRAGHGPTPGPPGTDIGVPGAVLPDHRQVPELGDGEGAERREGDCGEDRRGGQEA